MSFGCPGSRVGDVIAHGGAGEIGRRVNTEDQQPPRSTANFHIDRENYLLEGRPQNSHSRRLRTTARRIASGAAGAAAHARNPLTAIGGAVSRLTARITRQNGNRPRENQVPASTNFRELELELVPARIGSSGQIVDQSPRAPRRALPSISISIPSSLRDQPERHSPPPSDLSRIMAATNFDYRPLVAAANLMEGFSPIPPTLPCTPVTEPSPNPSSGHQGATLGMNARRFFFPA